MQRDFGLCVLVIAGVLVFGGLSASAQQPQPATAQPATAPPAAPAPPARGVVAAPRVGRVQVAPSATPQVRPVVDDSAGGQPVNVRLEVTIVDETQARQPVRKVITILAADRSFAQVRSLFTDTAEMTAQGTARNPDNRRVDVDARPRIVGNSIRVELTIQNNALGQGNQLLNWTQRLTMFLENGKSATPIESVDPSTNRKMSIEVKATILK